MKGRPLLFSGIIAIIAGLVLTMSHTSIKAEGIVVALGLMFVVVGTINLLFPPTASQGASSGEEKPSGFSRFLSMSANIAALGFGVSLLIFRVDFAPLIGVAFGVSLAACALWQAVVLGGAGRKAGLPKWLWTFPALLLCAALFVFLHKTGPTSDGGSGGGDTVVMITTGISLLVLGVGSLIEQLLLGIAARNAARNAACQPTHVEDVAPREILPPK